MSVIIAIILLDIKAPIFTSTWTINQNPGLSFLLSPLVKILTLIKQQLKGTRVVKFLFNSARFDMHWETTVKWGLHNCEVSTGDVLKQM